MIFKFFNLEIVFKKTVWLMRFHWVLSVITDFHGVSLYKPELINFNGIINGYKSIKEETILTYFNQEWSIMDYNGI